MPHTVFWSFCIHSASFHCPSLQLAWCCFRCELSNAGHCLYLCFAFPPLLSFAVLWCLPMASISSWACCHLHNFFIVMISQLFTCFLIGLFLSSLLNLKKESQSSISCANIFSHSVAWVFNFLMVLCILIHFAHYFSPESSLLYLKMTAEPKPFRFPRCRLAVL